VESLVVVIYVAKRDVPSVGGQQHHGNTYRGFIKPCWDQQVSILPPNATEIVCLAAEVALFCLPELEYSAKQVAKAYQEAEKRLKASAVIFNEKYALLEVHQPPFSAAT